jgi:hypothetical protein
LKLFNDIERKILFFLTYVYVRAILLLFSEGDKFVDISAGEVPISFLHNIGGYFCKIFVAGAYGCFYFFVVETILGLVFNELDLLFEFLEERLKADGKAIPCSLAFSHEVLVLFLEGFFVQNGMAMLLMVFIELSSVLFLAKLFAMS